MCVWRARWGGDATLSRGRGGGLGERGWVSMGELGGGCEGEGLGEGAGAKGGEGNSGADEYWNREYIGEGVSEGRGG